jgi:hypothetical protein
MPWSIVSFLLLLQFRRRCGGLPTSPPPYYAGVCVGFGLGLTGSSKRGDDVDDEEDALVGLCFRIVRLDWLLLRAVG